VRTRDGEADVYGIGGESLMVTYASGVADQPVVSTARRDRQLHPRLARANPRPTWTGMTRSGEHLAAEQRSRARSSKIGLRRFFHVLGDIPHVFGGIALRVGVRALRVLYSLGGRTQEPIGP
jgi:hypothetical protein